MRQKNLKKTINIWPVGDGYKAKKKISRERTKNLATGKRPCPKCGGDARLLYYDEPEREGSIRAEKSGRVIRYLLALECDNCGLEIGGPEELRAHGIKPEEELQQG